MVNMSKGQGKQLGELKNGKIKQETGRIEGT